MARALATARLISEASLDCPKMITFIQHALEQKRTKSRLKCYDNAACVISENSSLRKLLDRCFLSLGAPTSAITIGAPIRVTQASKQTEIESAADPNLSLKKMSVWSSTEARPAIWAFLCR